MTDDYSHLKHRKSEVVPSADHPSRITHIPKEERGYPLVGVETWEKNSAGGWDSLAFTVRPEDARALGEALIKMADEAT